MNDDYFRLEPEEPDDDETVDAAEFDGTEPEDGPESAPSPYGEDGSADAIDGLYGEEPSDDTPPEEPDEPDESEEPEETEEAEESSAGDGSETERAISSDLIRGHINTIILRSLYDGDKYGYEIIAEIERKSHNQYTLKQPSLYSALKRLEKDGYITSYWGGSVSGGRRKYFSLTDAGKEIAERNQTEWEYSRTVIDSLISDKDFNFESPAPAAVDMRVLRQSTSRVPAREQGEEEFDYGDYEEPAPEDDGEKARYEESLRMREEVLRAREEASTRREQELLEREFALQAEADRREQLAAEEEQARAEAAKEAEEQRRLQAEELNRQAEELKQYEEERARYEEEQAKLRAEQAEVQRRLAEEERARAEAEQAKFRAEQEAEKARIAAEEEAHKDEIELARAQALLLDKSSQNARIAEMEPFVEERAKYEQMLREQKEEFKAQQDRALAEQEARIREEDEKFYRQREQQMIHQNYLNLVNGAENEEPVQDYSYYYGGEQPAAPESFVYVSKPENEREYRSIIQKLYSNAVHEEAPVTPEPPQEPVPVPPPAPARREPAPAPAPAPVPAPRKAAEPARPSSPARALDGIDFYDLETRAVQDGIRISTSGGGRKELKVKSESLVHKGKALFRSALVVFLLCLAEGSIALGFQKRLSLPLFYPYLIWGTGLALLLVTGLLFLNHYGERALRQTGNLMVNVIVAFALSIILVVIVAVAKQIDFTDGGQLSTYIIFPILYFFSIVVFGVVYYLQIRPIGEE